MLNVPDGPPPGVLVGLDELDTFSDRVLETLDRGIEVLDELGRAARRRVCEAFSLEREAAGGLEVYADAGARFSASTPTGFAAPRPPCAGHPADKEGAGRAQRQPC